MTSKRSFRLLLSLFIAVSVFGTLVNLFFPNEVVGNVYPGINFDENPFEFLYLTVYSYSTMLLLIVSFVGLFMFKRWSRDLFVAYFLISIPSYFLFDFPSTATGITQLLDNLVWVMIGFMIAVMYLTPVSKFFSQREPEQLNLAQ